MFRDARAYELIAASQLTPEEYNATVGRDAVWNGLTYVAVMPPSYDEWKAALNAEIARRTSPIEMLHVLARNERDDYDYDYDD